MRRLQEGGSYELLKDAKHLVTGGKFEVYVPAAFEDKYVTIMLWLRKHATESVTITSHRYTAPA